MPGCNHWVTNREHAREGTSLTRPNNGLHLLNLQDTDESLHHALVSGYAEMASLLEPFKQAAGTRVDARIPRILQHNVSSNGIVQPPTAQAQQAITQVTNRPARAMNHPDNRVWCS